MRTCGGCHLSVTIGSASTSCRSSAPLSAISTLTGKQGCCSGLAGAGCRLRTRQNTPRVVWNGLFRRGGSRRRAGLLFFCRHTRAGRWSRHLPRRQLVSDEPERLEEASRRRRAGGILGPVVEIVAARHKRRAVHQFHGQRTPDDICTAALSFTW